MEVRRGGAAGALCSTAGQAHSSLMQHSCVVCRVAYVAACPGWRHVLWTSNATALGALRHLDEDMLSREPTPHGKSDILRAAVLYEHGGLYIDADTLWVNGRCLDDILLLASATGFAAALEPRRDDMVGGLVANGVMASVKHHPIVREVMHAQRTFTSAVPAGAPWQRLGPAALSAAVASADNQAAGQYCPAEVVRGTALPTSYFSDDQPAAEAILVTVLSHRYFYPIHWVVHKFETLRNMSYVLELAKATYPEALMYQFGFTTAETKGHDITSHYTTSM